MKHSITAVAFVLFAANLLGCGGTEPDATPVKLARYVTNTQCEPPTTTLRDVDAQLASAGISVYKKSCAWDGTGTVAVCGAATHYLRVVEVPQYQESTARYLGYLGPHEFHLFVESNCPNE